MAGSIAKMRDAVKKIDAAQPGYDQGQRWTFYSKGKVIPKKEADCSSVCGAIAQMGGYPVDLTGTFYTGNFNQKLVKAGFKQITFKKVSDVKVGDFINAPGAHVEYAYSSTQWYSARNDERGKSTGGAAGDQGGRENVGFGKPYDMSRGGSRKAYILRPPVPPPPAVNQSQDVQFRFGTANLQAQRFGGISDTSTARGKFLESKMKCSVYALQEVTETARNAIRKELTGGAKRWLVQEINYVCLLWDSNTYTHTTTDRVSFGTDIHGAVRQCLQHKSNGQKIDFISIHVRPSNQFTGTDDEVIKKKLADVQKGLDLRRPGIYTVIAGDFNTSHARKYIEARGFKFANDSVDTVDTVGDQKLDHIAVSIDPPVPVRHWSVVDPGSASDHKTLVSGLTFPGAKPTGPTPTT